MPQKQGNSTSDGGRLSGSLGTVATSAAFALGAGWGTTASISVVATSNDCRGLVTVTASGSGFAQATATVTMTFVDGAYAVAPVPFVNLQDNTQAVTDGQPTDVVATTTTLVWAHSVLPVDTKTYTFAYALIA